jgi:Tfp pilus assembly protein PilW
MEIRNQSGQVLIELFVFSLALSSILIGMSIFLKQKKAQEDQYKISKQTLREFKYINRTDYLKWMSHGN